MPDFPLNAWYAAAWSHEVEGALFPRTICSIPIVLYRRSDGAVAALEDACWHRMLPLSLGRLAGDEVVCGYHGLTFNASGRCTRMPSQDRIPSNAAVRAFPVCEKHRLIWLWPGEADKADPALIPDLHWADDPDWATGGGYLDVACDYRLIIDNLMDLTHETYVHPTSIGHDAVAESPFQISQDGALVHLQRWMKGTEAPPFLAMQLLRSRGLTEVGPVDRWQLIRFEPPATIIIDVGIAPAETGAPEGDRSQGVTGWVLNTITPGEDGKCHYFFGFARCFELSNEALTAEILKAQTNIFLEDKHILEAQQRAAALRPDRKLISLNIDGGSVRARRIIDQMTAGAPLPGGA